MIATWHLIRIAAMVGFFPALVAAFVGWMSGDVWRGGSFLILAVSVFAVAVWADSRIAVAGKKNESRLERSAADWAEHELVVQLRWIRWGICVLLVMSCAAWGTSLVKDAAGGLDAIAMIGACFLLAFSVGVLVPLLWMGWAALGRGYVHRVDASGWWLTGDTVLSWQMLRGIDLQVIDIRSQKRYVVIAAIDMSMSMLPPLNWIGIWLRASAWRLDRRSGRLTVPWGFVRGAPQTFVAAVRKLAQTYGAPIEVEWHHFQTLEAASKFRQQREELADANRRLELAIHSVQSRVANGRADDVTDVEQELKKIDRLLEEMTSRSSKK